MCIDFTNLNKACLKDSYPWLKIGELVDVMKDHTMLSFMNAFSGYHQIPLYYLDHEKTTFITDRGLYCYKIMPFSCKAAGPSIDGW